MSWNSVISKFGVQSKLKGSVGAKKLREGGKVVGHIVARPSDHHGGSHGPVDHVEGNFSRISAEESQGGVEAIVETALGDS